MLCHLFVSADIVKKITCDVTITEFDVHILWGFLTCLDFWAFYLFIYLKFSLGVFEGNCSIFWP